MTFKEIYEAWRPAKARYVKESTIAAYILHWRNHIEPRFGDMDVTAMTKKMGAQWIESLVSEKGLSVKTASDIMIVLKMLIEFASEEYDLNVCSTKWSVHFPTQSEDARLERFSESQVKKIFEEIEKNPSPLTFTIGLCLTTGMRIGEACGLRFEDIDTENKVMTINRTVERIYRVGEGGIGKTEVVIQTPKTITSRRTIPIASKLLKTVKAYKAVALPEYYVASMARKPEEPRVFRCKYKKFLASIGVPYVRPHGMRHTVASTLVEKGVDVKTVATILGHHDVATTLNIYSHPSDAAKSAAVNKTLQKAFGL